MTRTDDRGESAWERYCREQVRLSELQALVDQALQRGPRPVVLEAGCGSASWFRFPDDCTIVGVDISQEQLDRNTRISRKVLGDIQSIDLSGVQADVIVSTFVLEHLDEPLRAIRNLAGALRPGGIMVLIAPDPWSLPGLVTKLSPHGFHVWFYRTVLGNPNAGKPGYAPFRAPMRTAIRPAAVSRWGAAHGLETIQARSWQDYFSWKASSRSGIARALIGSARAVSKVLSLGKRDLFQATYAVVLRRPAA